MAWIEQISSHSWRVRYPRPDGSGYGTISGFPDAKTAEQYAQDMATDRRRGTWIDPAASKTTVAAWVERWLPTLDVEIRTEENYRALLRNHILPRWGHIALGDITALDTTTWLKQLRTAYAAATVATIRCVFSMLLDDAVNQHLIATSLARHYRRRGRRRDRAPSRAEKVFAMPEHILRIAERATELGGSSAGLLIITAAWTGCRGLRHSHKTWLIADHIPEIAQARRLGHHLANRLVEVYSHVAPEIEHHLLDTLEQRYRHAKKTLRPKDTRPRNRRSHKHAHHTNPAQRTTTPPQRKSPTPQLTDSRPTNRSSVQDMNVLQESSNHRQPRDHDSHGRTIIGRMKNTLRPGKTPDSKGFDQLWS